VLIFSAFGNTLNVICYLTGTKFLCFPCPGIDIPDALIAASAVYYEYTIYTFVE